MNFKTTASLCHTLVLLACIGLNLNLKAQQDTLFKTNGEKIPCKILEVGTNGVSYKKADNLDGPTFIDNKEDLAFIRFRNGQKQEFVKQAGSNESWKNTNNQDQGMSNKSNADNGKAKKGPISDEYKIVYDGRAYYVNGQKIGRRDVDRLLSRSANPAVKVPYKTAKATKTVQKIIGITSYPSTVTGGVASVSTFRTVFIEAQNGGAQPSSWVNAGLSFLGTLSLPITSKILKNRRNKLYDKTIDIYNLDKK